MCVCVCVCVCDIIYVLPWQLFNVVSCVLIYIIRNSIVKSCLVSV